MRQSAANAVARYQSRTCRVTFDQKTQENGLVVVVATCSGGSSVSMTGPSGFTKAISEATPNLHVTMWYREGAPSMDSVTVSVPADRSLVVRAFEYTGARQSGALDKVIVRVPPHFHTDDTVDTGYTPQTTQADQVVLVVLANRYASTVQSGFLGGFVRLFEMVSPQYYGSYGSNADSDRCRVTFHQRATFAIGVFRLLAQLSSSREWVALVATFRGGSSGPARLSSPAEPPPMLNTTDQGSTERSMLSAFGPLRSPESAPPMLTTEGQATSVILPFSYQFRLNGLLTGVNTRYDVQSHDGLYGYTMRTSDEEQPRGDGAQRGVDLQSARLILFRMQIAGTETEVEQLVAVLNRALRPQRATDWELVWRHPGEAARMVRCRPIELPREVTDVRTLLADQAVQLRCADPRHYSAVPLQVEVPVTPAGAAPLTVTARNEGNISAFPVITVYGPRTGPPVTRVELVNTSGLVTFDVRLSLPPGSVLVGDMHSRETGAPRSPITLDGQSKYGSWQQPRIPFRLEPDPYAIDGDNELYLRTEPAGAPVRCTLDYRHTWSG